jgi:hypothetical protein
MGFFTASFFKGAVFEFPPVLLSAPENDLRAGF